MLSVELFELNESIFGPSKVNILTSGYCKKEYFSAYRLLIQLPNSEWRPYIKK